MKVKGSTSAAITEPLEESSAAGSETSWRQSVLEQASLKERRTSSEPGEAGPFLGFGGAGGPFSVAEGPFPLSEEGRGGGTEDRDGVEVAEPE